MRSGDDTHPDQPHVIKEAPTGKAASVIEGHTLHSAFHFKFGNDHESLSDSLRDKMQFNLAKLNIVIIDEMSMVKADLIYQLNARLREIKQSEDYFGGVSVLLFGDLMQLTPVQANWIFEEPKNDKFRRMHAYQSLWSLFQPMGYIHHHHSSAILFLLVR